MKCKFCNKEMINGHLYWGTYVNVCKNHDVFYAENENFSLFGKDGKEIRINKDGEIYFSNFGARSIHMKNLTYFKGYVYGLGSATKKLIVNTEHIEVNIDNFDRIVEKLNKLVIFS